MTYPVTTLANGGPRQMTPEESAALAAMDWQAVQNGGAGGVGQVLTGTQVPLDAAYIANLAAQNNLTARGQDVSMRGQDLSYAASQQDAANQLAQIKAQYLVDVATLGLNTAQLNYQQRVAQLNAGLQLASTASQERQAAASAKMQAIQALADRSGPQDWVKYNRLLNGLGAATGQTTTVDPTAIANGILSPQLQQAAAGLDYSGMINGAYQPYQQAAMPTDITAGLGAMQAPAPTAVRDFNSSGTQSGPPASSGGTGIVPGATGAGGKSVGVVSGLPYTPDGSVSRPYVPDAGASPGVADYSGVPNSEVAGMTPGQWKMVTTGAAGPSNVSAYNGFGVYLGGTKLAPDYSIDPRTPIWLQKMSQGGYMRAPEAIIGEGDSKGLGDDGEILLNPTRAPLGVLSHEQARAILARDVTPKGSKKGKPKGYRKGTKMPGYASGTYIGINPNALEYTTYTPQQLGSQPFIQQLSGKRATSPFRGFGAQIDAPDLGIFNFDPRMNLQTYMQMDPSAQDMTQGLYGGLGLDFRDFQKQAQAAAPTTSDYSTYGMRQQPTVYGN